MLVRVAGSSKYNAEKQEMDNKDVARTFEQMLISSDDFCLVANDIVDSY